MARRALRYLFAPLVFCTGVAAAADFRATSEVAVLYDAPSLKAKPLFALGRDYPLEVVVNVEGWLKVRDASGTVAWIEKKSVAEKRVVVVRAAVADVLASADASAPVVFKAEQNVVLDLVDSDYVTATPGWAKVRHRDGQVGFVRIAQVWGL
jgi:SH3-like domain-containing protein